MQRQQWLRRRPVGAMGEIAPAEAAAGRRQSLAAGEQTVSVFLADLLGAADRVERAAFGIPELRSPGVREDFLDRIADLDQMGGGAMARSG
jgi:hypothetical protein